ncbi:MAG: hypothetical protein OES09_08580, partial [Gammaproteobacteria bacterium]|nr:hypothetical protein [Gammaproteobacteria bacterium]
RTTGKHLTTRHEGLGSHQVRIVEGQQAFIRSEQTSARPNWIVVYPPYGFVTGGGTEYGAAEGYYVTPRLSGNQVVLDIRHQQRSADGRGDSSLHTSELSVRVQGRLGEWMRIGAALGPDTVRDTDQHKRIARTASAEYAVEVKVESVNR